MMSLLSLNRTYSSYYLFNSRLVTHILFWIIYYISFALIWSKNHGLFGSFFLEFILLPMRITATYLVIYWSMPSYLLKGKLFKFAISWLSILIICGVLQRLFIYFFYEEFLQITKSSIFSVQDLFRAVLLINTTVMLAMTIKFYGIYHNLMNRKMTSDEENIDYIEIKSDRRVHLINPKDIAYIKGLGNYIKIKLRNEKELTSYITMKKIMALLPDDFLRVHKSYIINKSHINSYNNEDIQLGKHWIPRGKNILDSELK